MIDIEHVSELTDYLRGRSVLRADEALEDFRVLGGGVSNRTVYAALPDGREWVVKQALERLRVQSDWFSSPARLGREALALQLLPSLLPPGRTPPFVFYDEEAYILAMRAIPQPHENWKTRLLAGRIDAALIADFAHYLARMHQGAWEQRETFEPQFSSRIFFETLRLEPYYRYAGEQVPEAAAFMARLIDDTRANPLSLVHGDYSPKNMLVFDFPDEGEHLVVLDHEVMHWGDPAFDIGFSTTHLLSKALHLPERRSAFVHAATVYWGMYQRWTAEMRAASPGFENRAVRHTLGCLLARVDGRSPLEYLTQAERDQQRALVLSLMADVPHSMDRLISAWWKGLK